MYVPHTTDPKKRIRSGEMSCFKRSRFRSEMFVCWRKFEGGERDEFLGFRVLGFEDYH